MPDKVTTDSNKIFCDRYELDSYIVGPKRTWLNSNIRSNERTFECSLRNSNFAINSMRKCALISKVEKWHPHFKEWLQMLPVQVI